MGGGGEMVSLAGLFACNGGNRSDVQVVILCSVFFSCLLNMYIFIKSNN